jgi:hypothetical protein
MRVGARLAGAKLILLPWVSTTSRDAAFFWLPMTSLAYVVGAALALSRKAEQTVDMAKKRTKSDKAERQAEGLEKKFERRPAQVPKKKAA